ISHDLNWRSIPFKCYFNILLVGLRFDEGDRFLYKLSNIDILHSQTRRTAIVQQVANQTLEPGDLVADRRQYSCELFSALLIFWRILRRHMIDGEVNHVQRIADLVSYGLSQTSDRRLSLSCVELTFELTFRLESGNHLVKRAGELSYFIAPL